MRSDANIANIPMYLEPSPSKRWGRSFFFAVGAIVTTLATVLIVWIVKMLGDTYLSPKILERGPIPYLELFFFWLATIYLCDKLLMRWTQKKLFAEIREKWIDVKSNVGSSATTIVVEQAGRLLELTEQMDEKLLKSKAGSRLYFAVRRFYKTKSSTEVDDVLKILSDMDATASESSYNNLRFFVWLIPTLGFIGTVFGIGNGISGFGEIIQDASSFTKVQEKIPVVTHSLGIAFDTTLLALFLTAIILLVMSYLQKRDEDLLYQIDAFCVEEITGSFEEAAEEQEALRGLAKEIDNSITQQTKDITTYLDFNRIIPPVDLTKLQESIANIESRLDVLFTDGLEKIKEAIGSSSDPGVLRNALEDLKAVAGNLVEKMEKSFDELKQNLAATVSRLQNMIEALNRYVEEGGVSDATEFTKAVNELTKGLEPVKRAVTELSAASERLTGLSDLSGVAENLQYAANQMKIAASNAKDGGNQIGKAGADLTGIIADNKIVLKEVKEVMTSTTSSITDLRNNIIGMNEILSGISTAVLAVQRSIQKVADKL
jgi:biopolymer transport protein ExbB/TolQ